MKNKEYADRLRSVADKCFNTIMSLQGSDELKTTVQRLQKFKENKEKYSVTDAALPNYLWLAKRGGGLTTCLNAFSEYLYASNLIEFTGIVKYFEFIPAYTAPGDFLSELVRFNNTITEIAGHNRYYRGIACIIIDEWLDHTSETNFTKILDYIDNKNDKILAIFCAHTDNEKIINNIESAIKSYMRSETVKLRFPNSIELVDFIENKYLKKSDFYLAKDSKELLTDSINEIIKGEYFNGFKTIVQMANDIIYNLLTTEIKNNEITASMLSDYKKDSAYIKRIKSSVRPSAIGFSRGGE